VLASVLSVLAIAAAQAPPVAQPGEVKPPPGAKAPASEPAAQAAAKQLTFEPKTMVDGETLQVILGQRAVFGIDGKGRPVIDKVEEGQLAAAHPAGKAKETFLPPESGRLAAAVDGSAENRATYLKVWNGTGDTLEYRAMGLVMHKGNRLSPVPLPVCPVAPGAVRTESFPAPIVAVGLARFKSATKAALARPGCK
jgi:hypothetical protein